MAENGNFNPCAKNINHFKSMVYYIIFGGATGSQAVGRGFETRHPLHIMKI
ncbi:MAG: hypothetical protein ACK4NR_09125 [Micavibrio sp.]